MANGAIMTIDDVVILSEYRTTRQREVGNNGLVLLMPTRIKSDKMTVYIDFASMRFVY